jgi:hypothetical protein
VTGIDRWKMEYVAKELAVGFRVGGINHDVSAIDHFRLLETL